MGAGTARLRDSAEGGARGVGGGRDREDLAQPADAGVPSRRPSSKPHSRKPSEAQGVAHLVSMDKFNSCARLQRRRRQHHAWKQLNPNMSDEDISSMSPKRSDAHDARLPAGENAAAQLKRIGDFAMKKRLRGYHTHAQGSMTAFDQAFSSKGNMANVDSDTGSRPATSVARRCSSCKSPRPHLEFSI
jgi:hypothetical protein